MPRFPRALFLLLCLPGLALHAATPTEKSRASQKLLLAYRQEEPASVARAALPLAEKGNAEAQFVVGLLQDIGAGLPIDHKAARAWLEKAAAQKHAGAMHLLAWKAQTGFGLLRAEPEEAARWSARADPVADDAFVPWLIKTPTGFAPDFNRAFLWMIDAADDGNAVAMRNLAECYLTEYWTNANTTEHLRWLERASNAGNLEAMLVLSAYCEGGVFMPVDFTKALTLRQRAAEAGSALGQYVLGGHYEFGRGVPQDFAATLSWYTKSAKQDYVPAILRLIEIYRVPAGGAPPNFKEAVRLAERGRTLGDAACIRNLADLTNRGEGVKRDLPRSIVLYEEAAAKGDGPAMTMLGWIRRHGQDGKTNYADARRWFAQAADAGQIRAMVELGEMNEQGQGGANPSIAFAWYEKAARLGDPAAQQVVGLMLLRGRGVPKDSEEAVNWLRLANKNTPLRTLQPSARDWLKEAGELSDAVEGLLAVSREEQDPWLEYNLLRAIQQDLLQRPELEARILRLIDEPGLLAAPGSLPEFCLSVLEANPARQAEADAWFQKLLAADRLQSAWWLGRHALEGRGMPRDLARATNWAKVVSAGQPLRGAILTARCELQATDDPKRVEQAANTLLKFSDAGDPDAGLALAVRVVERQAKNWERQRVLARQQPLVDYARLIGRADLAVRIEMITTLAPHTASILNFQAPGAPDDSVLTEKVAAALKARKAGSTASPEAVHRAAPSYPYDMRQNNINGRVIVEFVIDPDGRVREASIVESSHPQFEAPAIAAVKQWRFVPAWKDGQAVSIRAKQLLEFSATSSPPDPQ